MSAGGRAFDTMSPDEIAQNALRGPLRDSDRFRDVAQPHIRVTGETEQHLGVTRNERPGLAVDY